MANIPIERKKGSAAWLPLLALLGLALLGFLLMRGCNRQDTVATPADTTATVAPTPGVTSGTSDADFGLSETANGVTVHGRVPSEAAKTNLLAAVRSVYPGVNVTDEVTVDAAATNGDFFDRFPSLVGYLSQLRNASLGLNGKSVTARGDVRSQAALDNVRGDLTAALPAGYTLLPEINVVAPSREVAAADSLIGVALVQPIPFETGSATLGAGAAAILDQVHAALAQYPTVNVTVEGHTDNTGNAAANQTLSQQRAESVMRYLVDKGIATARMRAVGYGQSRPVADNATDAGRAENRRVVFSTM